MVSCWLSCWWLIVSAAPLGLLIIFFVGYLVQLRQRSAMASPSAKEVARDSLPKLNCKKRVGYRLSN